MSLSTYTIDQIADMRQRRVCTKSHYKMTCGCCGKTIHRGDEITQVLGSVGRMRARAVEFTDAAADAAKGCNTPYGYAPTRNRWVHLTCRPQCFQDWGHGCSVGFFPIPTAYSHNLGERMSTAAFDPDWGEDLSEIPHPDWKWQTKRLAEAIVPLQRMVKGKKWRKQVFNAVTMLVKANEEVIYKWQDDHMRRVSAYLRLHFPRKTINPDWPPLPCNEGYRISWFEMVTMAVRTLDVMYCNWKHDWQLVIFKQLRKKYAK